MINKETLLKVAQEIQFKIDRVNWNIDLQKDFLNDRRKDAIEYVESYKGAKKTMKDLIDEKHELESTLSAVEKFILTLQNKYKVANHSPLLQPV